MKIIVTGGAGFIGSNFIRTMLEKHAQVRIINLDKLTYAGNLDNLKDVAGDPRYRFVKGDICDAKTVDRLAREADLIINFAAESHVDRSILRPDDFIRTNVVGTGVLLEAARKHKHRKFIQISTDEVYGSIPRGNFREDSPLAPSSPYSASKASADLLALSYHTTFGLPVLITRCTNNFGPYQYPEKLIPLFITNAFEDKPVGVYGDGKNVRDWIFVLDHCAGIDLVLQKGAPGGIYNIGGGNERSNLEITREILRALGKSERLIRHIPDRPGHDRRYALDARKLSRMGFKPSTSFNKALHWTIRWYLEHETWWRRLQSPMGKSNEGLPHLKKKYVTPRAPEAPRSKSPLNKRALEVER